MKYTILLFGSLSDVCQNNKLQINNTKIENTNDLVIYLETKYPELKHKNYKISVNQKIITTNTNLDTNSEIALLPPFAGG